MKGDDVLSSVCFLWLGKTRRKTGLILTEVESRTFWLLILLLLLHLVVVLLFLLLSSSFSSSQFFFFLFSLFLFFLVVLFYFYVVFDVLVFGFSFRHRCLLRLLCRRLRLIRRRLLPVFGFASPSSSSSPSSYSSSSSSTSSASLLLRRRCRRLLRLRLLRCRLIRSLGLRIFLSFEEGDS